MSQPIVTQGANATPPPAQAPITQPVDPKAVAAPPEAPVTPPETKPDPWAAKFAALSRQEKAFKDLQAAEKAQREAERREWSPKIEAAKRVEDLKAKAKTDRTAALELLKEIGLTYEELTKMQLNGGKPTAEMIAEQARKDVEALRQEQAEREKSQLTEAEKQKQARSEQAVAQFKNTIGELLKSKPDDFEHTLGYQDHSGKTGIDLVYDVIETHYDQTEKAEGTGRVMSHEEAAKIVEDYLEKDIEEKILSRKKVKAKLGQTASDPGATPDAGGGSGRSAGTQPGGAGGNDGSAASASPSRANRPVVTRTLTNADQTTVATAPTTKPKNREESLREAAKLLRWAQTS